ncbi:MBL fold metallo-hydrolase [Rodentibacter myodis]|uniref:Metallo-beta-lactamase domain-containing protein n=1 Tax=Rodentibacter myodis TaxID=1907939 RepID=A0A1V3JGS3_9PAST|nr:MBL fold metallo-hydrolase [Rodentibacter myodis]OOF55627.1 hypothetical protein BKL49_11335 [Rodentibacter myodis]
MNLKTLMTAVTLAVATATSFAADLAPKTTDSYQHIRNATGRINYAGKTFLIDPMLAEKGRYPGFEGTFNSHLRNPMVELPVKTEETFKDVDAIIVTHTHLDHWDEVAQKVLPKSMKIFVQHDRDGELLKSQGFTNVETLLGGHSTQFGDVTLSKTGGSHGTQAMFESPQLATMLDEAMGVVFQAKGHKTVYLVGDTIWTTDVNKAINLYKPEVMIMNTGDARVLGFDGGIIMGTQDVAHARKLVPNAELIAVHMDAVNHMSVYRKDLRKFVEAEKIQNVEIPEDGEVVKF